MTRMVSLTASLLMLIGFRCGSDGGTKTADLQCEVRDDAGEDSCECTPYQDSECGDVAAFRCGADGECHHR